MMISTIFLGIFPRRYIKIESYLGKEDKGMPIKKSNRFLVLVLSIVFILFPLIPNVSEASSFFKLKEQKVTISTGGVKQLHLLASSQNQKKVQWKSSNMKIATVNQNGKVTGKSKGTAKITAYIPRTTYKAVATIKVVQKVYNPEGIFKKVNPSMVLIELYNQYNQAVSTGSGIILSKDGKIATNLHVISDVSIGKYIKVKLADGRTYETSRVIGYNEKEDLAILKIDGPHNLPAAELGNSSSIATGEKVYALGSPKGIQNSITEGIISNISVKVGKVNRIQTSAAVSHGNSGGALVNKYGQVIGVVEASFTDGQNMNLAIPINTLKALKTNQDTTLLDVNNKLYPPLSGTGAISEKEENDYLDNADNLPYLENDVTGNIFDVNDNDVYSIYLTEYKTLQAGCTTESPEFSTDLGLTLYDQDGNKIISGDNQFIQELNQNGSYLSMDLSPGIYYVRVYANSDKLNWNQEHYFLGVYFK